MPTMATNRDVWLVDDIAKTIEASWRKGCAANVKSYVIDSNQGSGWRGEADQAHATHQRQLGVVYEPGQEGGVVFTMVTVDYSDLV